MDLYMLLYRRLRIVYRRVFTLLNVQDRWTRADAAIIAVFTTSMAWLIWLMGQV